MVVRNDVALGISRDLRHPDLERIVLYRDDLVLIAATRARAAIRSSSPSWTCWLERLRS
jgi:hypothetical protein